MKRIRTVPIFLLQTGFKLRQNGDYELESVITETQTKELLSKAKEFLEEAKKYLYLGK